MLQHTYSRTINVSLVFLLSYCLFVLVISQEDGAVSECLAEDLCPVPVLKPKASSVLSQLLGDQGAAWVARAWPVVQPAGISGVVGYATGLLVRKVVQMVILATAILITAVQGLAYLGWVTVHWERVTADLQKLMGGGSEGGMDASQLLAQLTDHLTVVASQGLPSVAGFTTGLTLAFMPGLQII